MRTRDCLMTSRYSQENSRSVNEAVESWDSNLKWSEAVMQNRLWYMEPHGLVSSALFTDYGQTTLRCGVYDRSVWQALSLCKCLWRYDTLKTQGFNLGIIPQPGTGKEHSIGHFKKGFVEAVFFYSGVLKYHDSDLKGKICHTSTPMEKWHGPTLAKSFKMDAITPNKQMKKYSSRCLFKITFKRKWHFLWCRMWYGLNLRKL